MAGTENEISEKFHTLINEFCISYDKIKTTKSRGILLDEMKGNHTKKYQKAPSLVPRLPDSELLLKSLAAYML